jgi:hypothetical protein
MCERACGCACSARTAGPGSKDCVRSRVGAGGDDTRVSHHDGDRGLGWVVFMVEAAIKACPWFGASTDTCAPTCWGSQRQHDGARWELGGAVPCAASVGITRTRVETGHECAGCVGGER